MIRLPKGLLDIETAATYCGADAASAWVTSEHVVLDLSSQIEDGDFDEDGHGWLTSIIPVRAEMAAGDLRALYLGWLLLRAGRRARGPRPRAASTCELDPADAFAPKPCRIPAY